jgi:hypothetical protein
MRVLLLQLDGKIPNIALMRISAHHKNIGDDVELRVAGNFQAIERGLWDDFGKVYASAIFCKTRPLCERLLTVYPEAVIGGTGWDVKSSLENCGIATLDQDYSIYPRFRQSIGFTQRGCRLRCSFCVVPAKEGPVRVEKPIGALWRGDPWPRELLLLDNDFFGSPTWRENIREIRDGRFKVSFNQGINARFLTDEAAEAIASIDYRDDQMHTKRIYTAWDSRNDDKRLFAGLERLVKYGVKPDHIMVYMLIGYQPGEREEDREYRRAMLRDFGARPFPMPFIRTPELVGFQRWVIGAYDKPRKTADGDEIRITWSEWKANNYRPENLSRRALPSTERNRQDHPT